MKRHLFLWILAAALIAAAPVLAAEGNPLDQKPVDKEAAAKLLPYITHQKIQVRAAIAELLGEDVSDLATAAAAERAEAALGRLLAQVDLDIRLRDLGVDPTMLPQMAADACRYMGGAVGNTPGAMDCAAVTALLERAY